MNSITISELKNKYKKAHEAFLKHAGTSTTNETERLFEPQINEILKPFNPYKIDDNFLNYLGVDYIITVNGTQRNVDVKICKNCTGREILVDVEKHTDGKTYSPDEVKINDWYLFINADGYFFVNAEKLDCYIKEAKPETFYMKKDLYKTTKKAVIELPTECQVVIRNKAASDIMGPRGPEITSKK